MIITGVIATLATAITWKMANFFLSRRDFYRNSPFRILIIKLGWCIGMFYLTCVFMSAVLDRYF